MLRNTAGQFVSAQMVNATDGTDFAGTATVAIQKDNGTLTAGGGTVTNKGSGLYSYAPTQAETDADYIAFQFKGTGAVSAVVQVYTLNAVGIRAALGLTSANLNTQLGDLPTVAEFEARTKLAADYFDPATDQIIVGTNNDKTGYGLTTAERTAVAVEVESHLLDEGDSQMLINAIVGAIGNINVDEVALVAAIRADLERVGGNLATVLDRLTATRAAKLDLALSTFNAATDGITLTTAEREAVVTAVWSKNITLISQTMFTAANYLKVIKDATGSSALRTALGLAAANLDTQLTGINTNVDAEAAAIIAHGDAQWVDSGAAPTVAQIAAGILATPANKLATNADGSVDTIAAAILEANVVLDTSTSPWQFVWRDSTTDVELMRKDAIDVGGEGVTSVTQKIGSLIG